MMFAAIAFSGKTLHMSKGTLHEDYFNYVRCVTAKENNQYIQKIDVRFTILKYARTYTANVSDDSIRITNEMK